MAAVCITLSDDAEEWARQRIGGKKYGLGGYVSELIAADRERFIAKQQRALEGVDLEYRGGDGPRSVSKSK